MSTKKEQFLKFLESFTEESDKPLLEGIKSGFLALAEAEENTTYPEGTHLISITFDKWDEEALEVGDTDDKGWLSSGGMEITTPDYLSMEPDEFDIEDGITAVQKTIKFLRDHGPVEYSGNTYSPWFTNHGEMDMQGIYENRAYHLSGYSSEELAQIVAALK